MEQILFWICVVNLSPTFAEATVSIFPETSISTSGINTTFICILPTFDDDAAERIQWVVNGSLLQDLDHINFVLDFSHNVGVGTLTFIDLPLNYNWTRVQCLYLGHGSTSYSNIAILILQGTLSAVDSLHIFLQDIFTCLTWSAPFTLDTMADITYCVDLVNSTSSSTLHSQCGINVTEFSYPTPAGIKCGEVVVTVTPVNAAGTGTPNNITYSQALESPQVMNGSKINPVLVSVENISHIVYHVNMTAPVCSVNISLVDLNTREETTLQQADISTQGSTVVFTSERLTLNRRYHVTITAANINGSAISNIDAISTHDILAVGIDPDSGGIHVQYSVHTRAMGSLLLFMFISNGEVDFSRSVYLTLDRNSSHDYTLPFQLLSGWYIISAYDIEESGLVQGSIAYPAFTETRFITGNTQNTFSQPTFDPNDCNITVAQELLSISILCIDLMATGYHVIVQRNILDDSEVSNLYVNESSGPHPATVQVDREGDYHVTVFPINEETGIVGTAVAYSAPLTVTRESGSDNIIPTSNGSTIIIGVGVGLGVAVLVAVVFGVILAGIFLAVQCRKTKTVNLMKESAHIQPVEDLPKGDLVYEEIGDVVKDSFMYTQNILYGVSSAAEGGVTVPGAAQQCNHEYEDVKLAGPDPPKSGVVYQMEQCLAYGVQ